MNDVSIDNNKNVPDALQYSHIHSLCSNLSGSSGYLGTRPSAYQMLGILHLSRFIQYHIQESEIMHAGESYSLARVLTGNVISRYIRVG